MTKKEREDLLKTLLIRFGHNSRRHKRVLWADVRKRLEANPDALDVLLAMESTGGEPDVVDHNKKTGEITFWDCSAESPAGRRSLCYDDDALKARKENKPKGSAVEMAAEMGIDLLTEIEYRELQTIGEFDTKTSSWVKTPGEIRSKGGAVFCDRRYDTVFLYHNGADSYYAARGFRGSLKV